MRNCLAIGVLLAVFGTSVSAWAHVEPGTYLGATAEGKECSMIAGETYFEKGTRHPLNERITMTYGSDVFVVGHPPIIESKEALVSFNHDLFQGLIPTSTGAKALEVEMAHSDSFEGPVSFTFMENNWKSGSKVSLKCLGIKLVKNK